MQQKVAIFDYENGRIIVRNVRRAGEDAAEAVAKQEGLQLSNCEWMGGALTLDIQ